MHGAVFCSMQMRANGALILGVGEQVEQGEAQGPHRLIAEREERVETRRVRAPCDLAGGVRQQRPNARHIEHEVTDSDSTSRLSRTGRRKDAEGQVLDREVAMVLRAFDPALCLRAMGIVEADQARVSVLGVSSVPGS
jgi:hypothetical protein